MLHNHQHTKQSYARETPLKGTGDSDHSIASATLFETPSKGGSKDNDTTSCSQELFGSPEMFTPAQHSHQSDPALEEESSKGRISLNSDGDGHTADSSKQQACVEGDDAVTEVQKRSEAASGHWEEETPQLLMKSGGEPHLLSHSTPLSSVTQPGPTTCSTVSRDAIPRSKTQPVKTRLHVCITPHNTPLCSVAQPNQPSPPLAAIHTPDVPVKLAKEPSPDTHSEQPLELDYDLSSVVQKSENCFQGPKKKERKQQPNQHNNYSFGSVGDVMDMLFMSSSQLDAHLTSHKVSAVECTAVNDSPKSKVTDGHPAAFEVCESPKSKVSSDCPLIISEVNESPQPSIPAECPSISLKESPKSTANEDEMDIECIEKTSIPSSVPQSPSQESGKQSNLEELQLQENRMGEIGERSETMDVKSCVETVSGDIIMKPVTEEPPLILNNSSTEKLPKSTNKVELPPSRTKMFHYPSKPRSNLKRKKTNIRTKEYSVSQKSSQRETAKVNALVCSLDDNVLEEPPSKRARISDGEASDHNIASVSCEDKRVIDKEGSDGVTKIEESVMEVDHTHIEREKSPSPQIVDSEISTKVDKDAEIELGEVASAAINEIERQILINAESERGGIKGMLVSSEKPLKPARAPGLRRINRKSATPARTDNMESDVINKESKAVHTDEDPPSDNQTLDQHVDNKNDVILDSNANVSKVPQFFGFQTAAGCSISVSEQALKRAQQLIGAELQLETADHTETELSEVVQTPKPTTVRLQTTASTTTADSTACMTPSEKLNSSAVGPKLKPTSSSSSFVTPVPSRIEATPQSSAATFPRKPGRRTAGKQFKAPRKASNVSSAEEQASVSRILRSFRASGAATEPPITKASKSRVHIQPIETGFQTAGGAKLRVSSKAMETAQKLVTEDKENGIADDVLSSPLLHRNVTEDRVATGFKSASGKGLSASSSSMVRAASILAKADEPFSSTHSKTPVATRLHNDTVSVGFQMASGKKLTVSAKSLLKAESMLSSDLEHSLKDDLCPESSGVNHHNSMPTGFQTAGGKGISVSSKSLKSAKKLVEGEGEESLHPFDDIKTSLFQSPLRDSNDTNTDSGRFLTGFSTAKGSSISVSTTSLQKCEKLIEIEKDEQKMSVKFDDCVTDPVKSTKSCNSPIVKDDETCGAIVTVDYLKENNMSPLKNNLLPHSVDTSKVSALCDKEVNSSELFVLKEAKAAEEEEEEKEIYDNGYMFSTQVVRQLTDFSSEEEMSCDEEQRIEITAAAAAQPEEAKASGEYNVEMNSDDIKGGACHTDNDLENAVEESVEVAQSLIPRRSQVEHRSDDRSVSRDELDEVMEQNEEEDVSDLLSESLALAAMQDLQAREPSPSIDDPVGHNPHMDDATLTVNLSGELTESMLENMDVSINISDVQPTDPGQSETVSVVQPVTAAKVCVVSAASGDDRSRVCTKPVVPVRQNHLSGDQSQSSSTLSRLPGLQTASGKQVHISERALEMAKQTLGSSSSELVRSSPPANPLGSSSSELVRHSPPTNPSCSLQTASGKPVHISESSLTAVRERLGRGGVGEGIGEICHGEQESRRGFPGLQTTSGKKVEISKSALLAVKEVLGTTSSIDQSATNRSPVSHDSPKPHPVGLMTASGHKVEISDEALTAVKSSTRTTRMSTALQTASGNKVNISEESLKAAKQLLDGDGAASSSSGFPSSSTGSGFPGLFTAGGAKVTVSQKALDAARATLDAGSTTACTPSNSNSSGSGGGGMFPGLMTAGGSKVTISESSLQAARAVLGATPTSSDVMKASAPSVSSESLSVSAPVRDQSPSTFSTPQAPSFMSTLPLTTPSSSLPGAPTRKYKPIFKSGGGKGGRSQSFAYPRVNDTSTHAQFSVNPADQTPWSRASTGVVSTPEGMYSVVCINYTT